MAAATHTSIIQKQVIVVNGVLLFHSGFDRLWDCCFDSFRLCVGSVGIFKEQKRIGCNHSE